MKVLLVNTNDGGGGAAIACVRLLRALTKRGADARMLVMNRRRDDTRIVPAGLSRLGRFVRFAWERWVIFRNNRFSRKNLFAVSIADSGTDITRLPLFREADVIHLHWVNQGFLSLRDVERVLESGKPVVWTLHDMWPFTGICHHARSCRLYETACSGCPFLAAPGPCDLSARVFDGKRRWRLDRTVFVGCSRWLAESAGRSALLEKRFVEAIPNPIDTTFWRPLQADVRARLGLPADRKLLLFGAANATDPRKGIDCLREALERLDREHPEWRGRLELVVAGRWDERLDAGFPFPVRALGYVESETTMRDLYAAADLFVLPSLEENLPNTVMEAMACGTPVAAFATGGIPEMVVSGETGELAAVGSTEELSRALCLLLTGDNCDEMGRKARLKVENEYAEPVVVDRYLSLYERVWKQSETGR